MILSNLLHDPEFTARVLPCLKPEFMVTEEHGILLEVIQKYVEKYDVVPSKDAVATMLQSHSRVIQSSDEFRQSIGDAYNSIIEHICHDDSVDFKVSMAEEHCKKIVCVNAATKIAELSQTPDKMQEAVSIMEDAAAFSFDLSLGFDVKEDADKTFEKNHEKRKVLSTGIEQLDSALGGGWEEVGLYVYMAGTGVGKSTKLIDDAAKLAASGKNGVYVSLELQDYKVSTRILSNILDIGTNKLKLKDEEFTINKESFVSKVQESMKNFGTIKIFEDLSDECSVLKIRSFLKNLKIKENFVPDFIIVDHLSKLKSIKMNKSKARGDEYLQSVANELRALSGFIKAPVITAEQTKREALNKLVISLDDIANAYAINREADAMIGIGEDEEYYKKHMWKICLLKLRETDQKNMMFDIGVSKNKQKTFSINSVATEITQESAEIKPLSTTDFDISKVRGVKSKSKIDVEY